MKKLTLVFVLLTIFISFPMIQAQTASDAILLGAYTGISHAGELSGSDLLSISFSTIKNKSNGSGYSEPDPDKTTDIIIPQVIFFHLLRVQSPLDLQNGRIIMENKLMKVKVLLFPLAGDQV